MPPTLGGAVENLLMSFIINNEVTNDFNLTVFSIKELNAVKQSFNFVNTKFIYIDSSHLVYKFLRVIRFIVNKIHFNAIPNQFLRKVLDLLNKSDEYDLILIENAPNYAKFVKLNSVKPIVLHLHNDYFYHDSVFDINQLGNFNKIITISKYLEKRINDVVPLGCKIQTVYNGIDLSRFDGNLDLRAKNQLRSKYNIKEDDILIIYSGRIQENKGIKFLLESFIELIKYHKNITLMIIGGTGFGNSTETLFLKELKSIAKINYANVIFTGYINYGDVHQLYAIGDFAVLPSLVEEAFGLTVLESLASGLPVIISDAGGMCEIINSKCGIIVNRGDRFKESLIKQMDNLIRSKSLRLRMSNEARLRSKLFSEEKFFKALSNAIKFI